jgi:hypothetical protein
LDRGVERTFQFSLKCLNKEYYVLNLTVEVSDLITINQPKSKREEGNEKAYRSENEPNL